MDYEVDNPTNMDDVMCELRQLRLAVQELTKIVKQSQPPRNDGRQLLDPKLTTPQNRF